jgi:hypothetical protein
MNDRRTFGAKLARFVAHSYDSNQLQLTAAQVDHDIRVIMPS